MAIIFVVVHRKRQPKRSHVAETLDLLRRFPCAVECRQQDGDQQRDNPDDDQKFDKRKCVSLAHNGLTTARYQFRVRS
jgi:hypothetical protein